MGLPAHIKKDRIPALTLVGAGPGDPELITLKGINAIRRADVVLYDALANRALLAFAPPHAIQIFVGKRRDKKAFTQEEINELIVDYARRSGHVVRLKGGDPFVFGRGSEEMQYALTHGIPAAYVPGISSVIAAPGAAGIPVTQRGASRGFWTLTATTDTGDLNPDIAAAAQLDTSVVILMGLSKLSQIAALYEAAGKPDWPAAVIQDGTLPGQRTVFGSVRDISAKVQASGLGSPAVIVLGSVVAAALPVPVAAPQLAAEAWDPSFFSSITIH